MHKNGFRSVLFGMSGGIDSTLVAAIAVDALGPENVFGVSNPSAWSSEHSKSDAAELAERTGLSLDTVADRADLRRYQESLHLDGLAEENLQARIRAVIWMGLSNQHGHLVLACGNKSELATGYSTIYGDASARSHRSRTCPRRSCGSSPAGATQVAAERGETPPIPEDTITKQPSAELRPGQLDSDSLPPYDLLDAVLDAYVERDLGSADVIAEGFDPELVRAGHHAGRQGGVQAPPVPAGPQGLPPQLRPRPPRPDHPPLAREADADESPGAVRSRLSVGWASNSPLLGGIGD